MTDPGQSYSEPVLDGRLIVNVRENAYRGGRSTTLISIGSQGNKAGSMNLTPFELAALLDGPLERALEEASKE
jgi:hypothetical protein